jgi:hypothetical protein
MYWTRASGDVVHTWRPPTNSGSSVAPEHLALEHLQLVDVAFDRPGAPAHREAGDNGVLIAAHTGHDGKSFFVSFPQSPKPDRFPDLRGTRQKERRAGPRPHLKWRGARTSRRGDHW